MWLFDVKSVSDRLISLLVLGGRCLVICWCILKMYIERGEEFYILVCFLYYKWFCV